MIETGKGLLAKTGLLLLLLWAAPAFTQDQAPAEEGVNAGNYNIQQTVEFGGRTSDTVGNPAVYNTFVNLQSGVRLYEHTLSMRSLNHQGLLFDNFYVSSFGYGGDPNSGTVLRAYKNTWYDFSASFRRAKNYWNYDLLANPLNPTTSNPSLILTDSPHRFDTVRRMSDFNLTLGPQSRVRVRLGYSRNVSEGPSFSTVHEGTESMLFQPWKNTVNAYRIGVDFNILPRTSFSYDQFLNYYKGDTTWVDQNFGYMLSNGVPVDLGIVFNTAAGQPCATPVSNSRHDAADGEPRLQRLPLLQPHGRLAHFHAHRAIQLRIQLFPQSQYGRACFLQQRR